MKDWEANRRTPPLDRLEKIATVTGKAPAWFLGDQPAPPPSLAGVAARARALLVELEQLAPDGPNLEEVRGALAVYSETVLEQLELDPPMRQVADQVAREEDPRRGLRLLRFLHQLGEFTLPLTLHLMIDKLEPKPDWYYQVAEHALDAWWEQEPLREPDLDQVDPWELVEWIERYAEHVHGEAEYLAGELEPAGNLAVTQMGRRRRKAGKKGTKEAPGAALSEEG